MSVYYLKDEDVKKKCIAEIMQSNNKMVTISNANKTSAQRKYWHKLIDIICEDTGEDKGVLKYKIKYRVLPLIEIHDGSEWRIVPEPSEEQERKKYGELIDATIIIGQELGLYMPLPGYFGIEKYFE